MPNRDSESLLDSVNHFPERFGRTYHAYKDGCTSPDSPPQTRANPLPLTPSAAYVYPNDLSEQARMEYQSQVIMSTLLGGRLHLAPFSAQRPPKRVLDVATGTGDWVVQMGDAYPTAYVEGIDLSPIQPHLVPPNVGFFVQDAAEPWRYATKFDYIHTSMTLGSFSDFKSQVIQQAFESLEPGGWLESLDVQGTWCCDDGTMDPEGALARWSREVNRASEAIGRPLSVAQRLRGWFEEVGFVEVQEVMYKMPSNGWPADVFWRRMGKMWEQNLLQGLDGFSLGLFSKAFGWTEEQVKVDLVDVRREIQDTRVHSYEPLYIVWGRKPFPGEGRG